MKNLETILTNAFETYPNLERVSLFIHNSVKRKHPIGPVKTMLVGMGASLHFNVQTYEDLTEYITPMLYTLPVKGFYTDKHEESISITLERVIGEE